MKNKEREYLLTIETRVVRNLKVKSLDLGSSKLQAAIDELHRRGNYVLSCKILHGKVIDD